MHDDQFWGNWRDSLDDYDLNYWCMSPSFFAHLFECFDDFISFGRVLMQKPSITDRYHVTVKTMEYANVSDEKWKFDFEFWNIAHFFPMNSAFHLPPLFLSQRYVFNGLGEIKRGWWKSSIWHLMRQPGFSNTVLILISGLLFFESVLAWLASTSPMLLTQDVFFG